MFRRSKNKNDEKVLGKTLYEAEQNLLTLCESFGIHIENERDFVNEKTQVVPASEFARLPFALPKETLHHLNSLVQNEDRPSQFLPFRISHLTVLTQR